MQLEERGLSGVLRLAEMVAQGLTSPQHLLSELRVVFNAASAMLVTPFARQARGSPWLAQGLTCSVGMDCRQQYYERWMDNDPWRMAWLERGLSMKAGTAHAGREYLSGEQLTHTHCYAAFASKQGLWDVSCLIVDDGQGPQGGPMLVLALNRARHQPAMSEADVARLRTLHLPLQRALSLYAAQQHPAPDLSGPVSAFAGLPQAVLVLRPDRQLIYANPAAESLLSLGDGRAAGGRLERLGQLEAADLDELLARSAAGTAEEEGLWFGPDLHTGRVHAACLAARTARAAAWPEGSLLLTVQRDAPGISQAARIAGLASRCALSPAERQVLELLCAGLSVGQVADRLGVRISTVRTHVRGLLEKTGAGRLMLLLAQMGTVTRHVEMV
ncbi:MAG: hypothetical protein IV092_22235 [Burkholderiaceae bacterium]|nr:hypothetical protein [Burkholderiaceae bacterium]